MIHSEDDTLKQLVKGMYLYNLILQQMLILDNNRLMRKKTIIITSILIVALVCVIVVLCVIRSNQNRNSQNEELPIISDEGVREDDIVDAAREDMTEELTDLPQNEAFDSSEIESQVIPSQEMPGEGEQDSYSNSPLDNNELPIIIG